MEIEAKLIALAAWMKKHYGGTMIQALKTVLPIKQKENAKMKRRLRLLLSEEEGRRKLEFYLEKNQKARARLMAALLDDHVVEYELVTKKLNITLPVIRALEEQGVLAVEEEQVYRNPVKKTKCQEHSIIFTDETALCDRTFSERLSGGDKKYLSSSRCDRKRQDGSVYGDDTNRGREREAGHCSSFPRLL